MLHLQQHHVMLILMLHTPSQRDFQAGMPLYTPNADDFVGLEELIHVIAI